MSGVIKKKGREIKGERKEYGNKKRERTMTIWEKKEEIKRKKVKKSEHFNPRLQDDQKLKKED